MKNFSDNEISEAYQTTNDAIRDVIFSTETTATIGDISEQNNIPEDQMYLVAEEVLFLIIGLTRKNEVAVRLKERLATTDEQAQHVAQGIFKTIFEKNNIALTIPQPVTLPQSPNQPPTQIAAAIPQQPTPPPIPPPPQTPPVVPPPPIIPQYQKPLTNVPPYRNANLYKKPPQ